MNQSSPYYRRIERIFKLNDKDLIDVQSVIDKYHFYLDAYLMTLYSSTFLNQSQDSLFDVNYQELFNLLAEKYQFEFDIRDSIKYEQYDELNRLLIEVIDYFEFNEKGIDKLTNELKWIRFDEITVNFPEYKQKKIDYYQKYNGHEDEFFSVLSEKLITDDTANSSFKKELNVLFQKYRPHKINLIDSLLCENKGHETELIESLRSKFNLEVSNHTKVEETNFKSDTDNQVKNLDHTVIINSNRNKENPEEIKSESFNVDKPSINQGENLDHTVIINSNRNKEKPEEIKSESFNDDKPSINQGENLDRTVIINSNRNKEKPEEIKSESFNDDKPSINQGENLDHTVIINSDRNKEKPEEIKSESFNDDEPSINQAESSDQRQQNQNVFNDNLEKTKIEYSNIDKVKGKKEIESTPFHSTNEFPENESPEKAESSLVYYKWKGIDVPEFDTKTLKEASNLAVKFSNHLPLYNGKKIFKWGGKIHFYKNDTKPKKQKKQRKGKVSKKLIIPAVSIFILAILISSIFIFDINVPFLNEKEELNEKIAADTSDLKKVEDLEQKKQEMERSENEVNTEEKAHAEDQVQDTKSNIEANNHQVSDEKNSIENKDAEINDISSNHEVIKKEKNLPSELPISSQNDFYLIAGSFKNEVNAEKFLNNLYDKGFSPINLGLIDGYYKIAYAKFNDLNEAQMKLESYRNKGVKTWILR